MKYKDIFPNYDDYLVKQITSTTNESIINRFVEGQIRYLDFMLKDFPKHLKVLDVGCGEGIGLQFLKSIGFSDVVGIDLSPAKVNAALNLSIPAMLGDFHSLPFEDKSFDVVYCSHALEHAYEPMTVVKEMVRIMRSPGVLLVVLPYPDCGEWNETIHGGKFDLGTNIVDEGKSVENFFRRSGFDKIELSFDDFREPEIWVTAYSS